LRPGWRASPNQEAFAFQGQCASKSTTGTRVWADRYDRSLADIFAVQDEITSAVAKAIGPAIVEAELKRAMRKPPEGLGA
jgi:adenylate cyclase